MAYTPIESHGSPIDGGSSSGGEHESMGVNSLGHTLTTGNTNDITQNVGLIGNKSGTGTNNFVTKLYQCVCFFPSFPYVIFSSISLLLNLNYFYLYFPCVGNRMISDPKSSHFISWTELGTRCGTSSFPLHFVSYAAPDINFFRAC